MLNLDDYVVMCENVNGSFSCYLEKAIADICTVYQCTQEKAKQKLCTTLDSLSVIKVKNSCYWLEEKV